MRHTEGDYLVVEHDKTNRLVRFVDEKFVLRDKQSVKLGDYNEIVDISPRDFIANMGDAPRSGSVYGVQCDPIFKRMQINGLGPVYFMRKMKSDERDFLIRVAEKCVTHLKELDVLPAKKIVSFVKPPKRSGKLFMLGTYYHRSNAELPDEMELFAETYRSKDDVRYAVYHELAHGIWFTRTDDDIHASWIEAFEEAVEKNKYGANSLAEMRDNIVEAGSLAAYRKSVAEPVDLIALKEVMKYLSRVHSLSSYNLRDLLKAGRGLKKVWPQETIVLPNQSMLLTEYAMQSPEELFADTLSYYLAGRKVPKSLASLAKKTLEQAKHIVIEDAPPKRKKEDD